MLELIAFGLVIFWIIGLITNYSLGGFIHILLVAAIIVLLIRIVRGRNPI